MYHLHHHRHHHISESPPFHLTNFSVHSHWRPTNRPSWKYPFLLHQKNPLNSIRFWERNLGWNCTCQKNLYWRSLHNITLQEGHAMGMDGMMIVVPLHIALPFPLSFRLDSLQTYKRVFNGHHHHTLLAIWFVGVGTSFFSFISSQISTTPLTLAIQLPRRNYYISWAHYSHTPLTTQVEMWIKNEKKCVLLLLKSLGKVRNVRK